MNKNDLCAELARCGLSIPKAADAIGIGKKSFYEKMSGKRQFKQTEMKKLKDILNLDDEKVMSIFLLIKYLLGNFI